MPAPQQPVSPPAVGVMVPNSLLHLVAVPLLILGSVAAGAVLVYLKEILVPFTVAVFFVYLLRPLVDILTRPFAECGMCWCCRKGARATGCTNCACLCQCRDPSSHRWSSSKKDDDLESQTSLDGFELVASTPSALDDKTTESGATVGSGAVVGTDCSEQDEDSEVKADTTIEQTSLLGSSSQEARRPERAAALRVRTPGSGAVIGKPRRRRRRRRREHDTSCTVCGMVRCPRWLAILLSLGVAFGALSGLVLLVADAVQKFEDEYLDSYRSNAVIVAETTAVWLQKVFHVDAKLVISTVQANLPVADLVQNALVVLVDAVGNTLLILLVVLYLLFEQSDHSKQSLRGKVDSQIQRYLVIKTLISLMVGGVVYVVLEGLGVKLAHLFGVLTFLLNYIPNVGPIIATVVPVPLVVLDPDLSSSHMMLAFLLPSALHMVIGNVVEPKWFGHSLELHPVVVLLALAFWFAIWGIPGAILSIPITAVMRIILSHMRHPYALVMIRLLEGHIGLPEPDTPGMVPMQPTVTPSLFMLPAVHSPTVPVSTGSGTSLA